MLAVGGLLAASTFNSHAQPYFVAGDFNGWNASSDQMTGGPSQYDFTITGQTPDAYGQIKVTDGTFDHTWPGNNVVVRYDSTGSVTVHFYPGNSGDGWLPLANRVGYEDTGNLAWGVAGSFNGWDGTQSLLPSIASGVYSNSIDIATAGNYEFKFQSPAGSWDHIYFGSDFGNGGSNGSYSTTNSPQSVPFVLDVAKGRFLVGNLAPPPVTNEVVFAVDMTYQIQLGYFHPGSAVFVAGDFNGWPGTGVNALPLVNDPPYMGGSNTNIWYGTNTFIGIPNAAAAAFKYTQNDPSAQNSGWETSDNRTVTLLSTNGTLYLPVAIFSDLFPSTVLSAPTPVFFRVDMNGAVGTDAHVFDPYNDHVYVNGQFASWYAWAGGINPSPAPPGYEMIQEGSSTFYTNTIIFPVGTPVSFQYKYGIDPSGINGGPLDNEAGFALNHHRAVRSTALNPYPLPTDTFGTQYAEPFFDSADPAGGRLTVGTPSGGAIPVSWLGRPGAHLQVKSDLTGGTWQDLSETDGGSWTSGYSSANGFVSLTNWPAADNAFFRLIKP